MNALPKKGMTHYAFIFKKKATIEEIKNWSTIALIAYNLAM